MIFYGMYEPDFGFRNFPGFSISVVQIQLRFGSRWVADFEILNHDSAAACSPITMKIGREVRDIIVYIATSRIHD